MVAAEFLFARTQYPAEGRDLVPGTHIHAWHELILVARGGYEVEMEGKKYEGGVGSIFYYPAKLPHQPVIKATGENVLHLLQWRERLHAGIKERPNFFSDASGRWLQGLEWLVALMEKSGDEVVLARNGILQALLLEFEGENETSSTCAMRRVHWYMRYRLDQDLDLKRLARIAHMSPEHLTRRYSREMGVSPMRDLRRLRVEAAGRFLRTTDLKIEEIAKRLHFCDAPHLERLLHEHFGRTAHALRRSGGITLKAPPHPGGPSPGEGEVE
jgi:AraC-like DNA-binding protein